MSQHELLAAHLRSLEDYRCNLAADALEAQDREIAKLEQENDLFRQHAARQMSDATLLTGIDISNGSMNMGLQGGAAQLLAESFFDLFQTSEAVNYLELRFESESKMPGKAMIVTLQLVGGITPGQRIAEQEREIEALRKDAERYRWLRDTCWLDTPLEHVICLQLNAKWDRAIDEAIEAAKGEPHGIPPTT